MMTETLMEVDSISFAYDLKPLFSNVSLNLSRSEMLIVLGENGSGKSTLLKLLTGILKPLSGEVKLDRKLLSTYGRRALATRIAYAGDEIPVDFPLKVFDYLCLSRFPRKGFFSPLGERDRDAVREAMEIMELSSLGDRYIQEISSGEKQRALIARALAQGGDMIVMDEPSAHLDVRNSLKIFKILKSLAQKGKTVVVASHDSNLTGRFADSVLILRDGMVIAHGKSEDVITESVLENAFGVKFYVDKNPFDGSPRVTVVE